MRNLLLAALNEFVLAINYSSQIAGKTTDEGWQLAQQAVSESFVRLANLILSIPDDPQPKEEALPQ